MLATGLAPPTITYSGRQRMRHEKGSRLHVACLFAVQKNKVQLVLPMRLVVVLDDVDHAQGIPHRCQQAQPAR